MYRIVEMINVPRVFGGSTRQFCRGGVFKEYDSTLEQCLPAHQPDAPKCIVAEVRLHPEKSSPLEWATWILRLRSPRTLEALQRELADHGYLSTLPQIQLVAQHENKKRRDGGRDTLRGAYFFVKNRLGTVSVVLVYFSGTHCTPYFAPFTNETVFTHECVLCVPNLRTSRRRA